MNAQHDIQIPLQEIMEFEEFRLCKMRMRGAEFGMGANDRHPQTICRMLFTQKTQRRV